MLTAQRPVGDPRRAAARFLVLFFVLSSALTGAGWVLGVAADRGHLRWDVDVSASLAANRVSWLDRLTLAGSRLADTEAIVVFAAVACVSLCVLRSWPPALAVAGGLLLELAVFLTAQVLVDRPRPSVVRLGSTPSTGSFPSGHVAAAIVLYGAIALVLAPAAVPAARAALWGAAIAIALLVAFARVYRGMHHVTDVVAGAVNGLCCLAGAWWAIGMPARARDGTGGTAAGALAPVAAPGDGGGGGREVRVPPAAAWANEAGARTTLAGRRSEGPSAS